MKKFLPLVLCLLLVICLIGCNNKPDDAGLKVGYGKADITPEKTMPLQGYPDQFFRYSSNVLDPIYVTAITFTDNTGSIVVLLQYDLADCNNLGIVQGLNKLSKTYGIDRDRFVLSATHTHSAPWLSEIPGNDYLSNTYSDLLRDKTVAAVTEAMENQLPAEIYAASIETNSLNFCRHYRLEDGTLAGDDNSLGGRRIVSHMSEPDRELQLLRFKREGGKDVVLANFQAHANIVGGLSRYELSSDFIGPMTTYVEENLNCHFAYFSGASGNVDARSRISSENVVTNHIEQGQSLGQFAEIAFSNMKKMGNGAVKFLQTECTISANSGGAQKVDRRITAFSIGDVAFINNDYEMFSSNGEYIKDNSPFKMTFITTIGLSTNCYIPDAVTFAYEGTTYEETKCFYEEGSAEILADSFVDALNQLHEANPTTTTEDNRVAKAQLYWNADKGMERAAEADGSYQVSFLRNGQLSTLRVADKETMDRIDSQKAVGLLVDKNNTVTDVFFMADMPQSFLALNYTVQSMGGNYVKINSLRTFNGVQLMFELTENIPVYDVSEYAEIKGTPTTLQKGDGVTIISDNDGTILAVYVDNRQGIYTTTKRYCPICEKDVDFTNWFSAASMPFMSGHYYLEKDIDLAMSTSVGSGEITIDLNGKTITMINEGQRFYTIGEYVILNLIDTVGDGKAVVASGGKGPFRAGMFVRMDGYGCEFNMYSGTIDASNAVCDYGCIVDNYNGVFNMYGGTLIGGTTYGVGGGAVIVQNHVNIYGGEIIGGYCADLDGYKNNPPGGGCIRHNGAVQTLNIYGGIIRDGKTDYHGGCIYSNGPTFISGNAIITGGSAALAGGGVYASVTADITISGSPNISGNENGDLYFSEAQTVTIGEDGLNEDAKICIDMEIPATFTENPVAADRIKCFSCTRGKIVRNADGTLQLK